MDEEGAPPSYDSVTAGSTRQTLQQLLEKPLKSSGENEIAPKKLITILHQKSEKDNYSDVNIHNESSSSSSCSISSSFSTNSGTANTMNDILPDPSASASPNNGVSPSIAHARQAHAKAQHNQSASNPDEAKQKLGKDFWWKIISAVLVMILVVGVTIISTLMLLRNNTVAQITPLAETRVTTNVSSKDFGATNESASHTSATISAAVVAPTATSITIIDSKPNTAVLLSEMDQFFAKPFFIQSTINVTVCLGIEHPVRRNARVIATLCPLPVEETPSETYAFTRDPSTFFWKSGVDPSLCIGKKSGDVAASAELLVKSLPIFPGHWLSEFLLFVDDAMQCGCP
jgi:hypothetical protein